MQDATHKLNLWHVKLTGGDVSSNNDPEWHGGQFLLMENLVLKVVIDWYYSEISGNKAKFGGGISAYGYHGSQGYDNKNSIINVYNSIIKGNEATSNGGGISPHMRLLTFRILK